MYGEWLVGFCDITTNLNAELLAIHHGLQIAWDTDHRSVVCESYFMTVLNLVTNGVHHFHPYSFLVNKIRNFMSFPWSLHFCHTLREGNECAD